MNKIIFTACCIILLSGCVVQPRSIIPPVDCKIPVATTAVKKYRQFLELNNPREARRLYENQCELDEKQSCAPVYVDAVERYAHSKMSLQSLLELKRIQVRDCE